MRRGNVLSRLHQLESQAPQTVILYLEDGREFHYPGDAMEFIADAMDQLNQTGRAGQIIAACRKTISARGCGRLWEIVTAVAEPVASGRKGEMITDAEAVQLVEDARRMARQLEQVAERR